MPRPATGDDAPTDTSVEPSTATERVQRQEEHLAPRVAPVEVGRVRIRKRVVDEPMELDVSLRQDKVELDRRPADRPLGEGEDVAAVRGDETILLVIEERLEVRKVPWVVEEIRVRRRSAAETRRITDTVRREGFDIRTEGDVDLDDQR